jgi:hypothetical protein
MLGASPALSTSPLSEVAVVRLPPEPLRMRAAAAAAAAATMPKSLDFAGTGGGRSSITGAPPHSLPLAAA